LANVRLLTMAVYKAGGCSSSCMDTKG